VAQVNQAAAQQFSLDLANFAVAVQIDIELLLKAIAFQIFVDIVNATPVDTGRARASWTISAGSQSRDTPRFSGNKGTGAGEAAMEANNQLTHMLGLQVIYIDNNLPYIGRLEEGSSTQAPRGMVRPALSRANSVVNSFVSQA